MRLRGLLVAPLVLAGCTGGGHATPKPHGVYEATIRDAGHHAVRTVWLDAATGRFRVRTVFRDISGMGDFTTVTVFDGRVATQQLGRSRTLRITGSPRFVADRAGADLVAPLRAKLTGSPLQHGVSVVRLRRLHHIDARRGGVGIGCNGTAVHLADGSPATVVVVQLSPKGSGQCSTSSGNSSTGIVMFSTDSGAGTFAYVVAPRAIISLSGRSVTPKSAAAIARALRPV